MTLELNLKNMTEENFCQAQNCLPPKALDVVKDQIGDRLDELADLAELWKKWRARGGNPHGIRCAMVILSTEISILDAQEKINEQGSRTGRMSGSFVRRDVPL